MSDTFGHKKPREKLLKRVDKYTGWIGECCNGALGRRFIKRLQRRANRRYLNKIDKDTP